MLNLFFRYYLDNKVYLCNLLNVQNRSLLDTLRKLKSSGGSGEIVVFNTLAIGHTKHPHEQRISSWPLKNKIEGIPSSGLCLHTPARNFTRGL